MCETPIRQWFARRKWSTQTRESHRTSRNGGNHSLCGIKATGHGNNKLYNIAIVERVQSEGCCSPSSPSIHQALPSMLPSGFLLPPCPLTCYAVAIPNQRGAHSSSGLRGIGFKSNLKKVVLGQTKGSRTYALDLTFTVT